MGLTLSYNQERRRLSVQLTDFGRSTWVVALLVRGLQVLTDIRRSVLQRIMFWDQITSHENANQPQLTRICMYECIHICKL